MIAPSRVKEMSPQLRRVVERAERDPEIRHFSLAHLIDEEALKRAYRNIKKGVAVGVDGTTKEQYGQELDSNVRSLHQRLKTMRYRHQPIRRVHIPKGRDKTRPIGISSTEDKVVQGAVRDVLEAVYEPIFRDCSYGFRPGRRALDAIRVLNQALYRGEINWILEADIQSFFDRIDRKKLLEMLRVRMADKSLRRLVGKCLHVGVLDGEEFSKPEEGAVQGSVLSPLLGNVYLHHVLDLWFERDVLPRMRGEARLIRYADDFIIGFKREDDAKRVMRVLHRRFERYGLNLHPGKTRLLPFGRPDKGQQGGKGPATFDFLGFTAYWLRSQNGHWVPRFKTRKASLRRARLSVADWCRRYRHLPVKQQHAKLKRKLDGHYNYFGVNGNLPQLGQLLRHVEYVWHKWLNRRSQRARKNWDRFNDLLRDFPLPVPQVRFQLWQSP